MFIVGIDASINGSGVVKFEVEDGQIISSDYMSFTTVKKLSGEKIHHFKKKDFEDNFFQYKWTIDKILEFIPEGAIVGIEGYALGGKGQVFDIAEFTGTLKQRLVFEHGCSVKAYPPTTCKMWFSGQGNADKMIMCDTFFSRTDAHKIDIEWLDRYKSPQNDLVDAWGIADMVYHELNKTETFVKFCETHKKKKSVDIFNMNFFKKVT